MQKRVLLCILDGWGISSEREYNAIAKANTPNYDSFVKNMSYAQIHAEGSNVGLPKGQMGNSEVGHLNIGAGRIVYQELSRINKSIEDGDFFKNEEFLAAINHVKENKSALHLFGLVSDGGVHSVYPHLQALIKIAADNGLCDVYVHAFLDGRDTPPKSAIQYLEEIEKTLAQYHLPKIASVMGRFWAMDRDKRWDRVERAYNCLVLGEGNAANSAIEAVENSYKQGITDEFVDPAVISKRRIEDNDSVIFFNYRPDRAREITNALTTADFTGFERKKVLKNLFYVCMTQYDEKLPLSVAFKPEAMKNILGGVLDKNNVLQFRTAETDEFAHVTFFFNRGLEVPYPTETRVLVPSPKVKTYDLQPEMSAGDVCENVLKALDDPKYGFILVNFANPDMVGHTGIMDAAIKAVETVDNCIGKIAAKVLEMGVVMILTADHGNAEDMVDKNTHQPHTAHTTNPVPFIIIDSKKYDLKESGALSDIAPTVLEILGIEKPQEMTGESMIKKQV